MLKGCIGLLCRNGMDLSSLVLIASSPAYVYLDHQLDRGRINPFEPWVAGRFLRPCLLFSEPYSLDDGLVLAVDYRDGGPL